MKQTKKGTLYLVQSAIIAALYAAVTYFIAPISYGAQQFRISEALTILPVLTPAAIPGLTVGCLLSNLSSPYGIIDIICGTLATFLAAVCTRMTRKILFKNIPFLSFFFPVLFNGIIIGAEISFLMPEGFSFATFVTIGLSVAFGEAVVCYALGTPLYLGLKNTRILKDEVIR